MKKTFLITGAAGGIGQALVRKCLEEGHTVIGLDKVFEMTSREGSRITIPCDVAEPKSLQQAWTVLDHMQISPNVIVHLAAIMPDKEMEKPSIQMQTEVLRVNFHGAVNFIQQVGTHWKSPKKILVASSGRGQVGDQRKDAPAYSESKRRLNEFIREWAVTFNGKSQLISFDPGWVKTEMGGNDAPRTPQQAADDIYALAMRNDLKNGSFVDWTGKEIPW